MQKYMQLSSVIFKRRVPFAPPKPFQACEISVANALIDCFDANVLLAVKGGGDRPSSAAARS